jgi:hypothetical protein
VTLRRTREELALARQNAVLFAQQDEEWDREYGVVSG